MTIYFAVLLGADKNYISDSVFGGGGAVTATNHIRQISDLIRSKLSFPTKLVMTAFLLLIFTYKVI